MIDPDAITLLSPPDIYRPLSYEHAAIVGDLVFVAGQVARDAQGELVAPGDIVAQAVQAYANLARVLEVAGRAERRDQSPRKCGLRFSLNARMPS